MRDVPPRAWRQPDRLRHPTGDRAVARQRLWMMVSFLVLLLSRSMASQAQAPATESKVWSAAEWAAARRLSPLRPLPLDPTNALADHPEAARLGHHLFFDPRLSPHGVACATCHQPARGFTDGRPVAHTLAPLRRNTMSLLNVGYQHWLTWDGGRDSLWHQAVVPIESAQEMGSSRLYVVRAVMQHYGAVLRQVASLPAGWEALWPTLPPHGQPGEAAFDTLPMAQREAVNRVFVLILKCLAAYERRLVSALAPFDRYVAGEADALSPAAQRGFQHFLRLECDNCHHTPLFANQQFHNLALPPLAEPDVGRPTGLRLLAASPWRASGPYADQPLTVRVEDYRTPDSLLGAFRTPSLRELATTAPYGHNGTITTLEEWLQHYQDVTLTPPADRLGTLDPTLTPVALRPTVQRELVAFLLALSSDYTSPWTQPPVLPSR